jgi:hypothetical protein
MDEIACSGCAAEPGNPNATQSELELEGWDFNGEFGPQCPECLGKTQPASSDTAGIAGIAEAMGAVKKENVE